MSTLTGKTRFRTLAVGFLTSKTHLLVLQVEENYPDGPDDWRGMPTYLSGTHWRDATTEDLASLDITTQSR